MRFFFSLFVPSATRREAQVTRYLLPVTCYSYLFFLPLSAFAFNATDLLNKIGEVILNPIIYILFSAAFVVFIWGLVQFVSNLQNEEARSTGVRHMIWGIIGMVVMVGVRSILDIVNNTLCVIGGGTPPCP
ncbi:MAG: hypothetical protein AAB699_00530 [Patescibacteria group bacterium]